MLNHFVMWSQIEWITDITRYEWSDDTYYTFYVQTKSGRKLEYQSTNELDTLRARKEIVEKAQGWLYLASKSHVADLL